MKQSQDILLGFDGDGDIVDKLSVTSSQNTTIMPQSMIDAEVRAAKNKLEVKKSLASPFPIPRCDGPATIMPGLVVETVDWFNQNLELVASMTLHFGRTLVCPTADLYGLDDAFHIDEQSYRFIFFPFGHLEDLDEAVTALIIIDTDRKEWVYADPCNLAKDEAVFQAIKEAVTSRCPDLCSYECWPIRITCTFHHKFTGAHLVMTAYTITRYFRYALRLPQKVIYAEREFREYVHEACWYQRVVNHEYNARNGLIKRNGYYKDGARVSLASSLDYHRSVVPSDQCPFCCERYISKLAQHIRMKHGGGAAKANVVKSFLKGLRK
jgi:hypothetical protein